MARDIWVSPDEFVAFSEPQKSLTAQTASRSHAIDFYGLGIYLSNPNPILETRGRDIRIYRELRTDPPVRGCIRRRETVLKSLERGLERSHASARVFRFIRDMLDGLDLSRIIGEISGTVLYGYQPYEIMWDRLVRAWTVTDIVDKPPEWSQSDTNNCLRFRTRDAGAEGELLPPSKFVVPAQDASYDNPYGFPGLLMCFWPAVFRKGGVKFWLRFAEKFGSPWVIGKHPRGANDAEIEKLLDSMEQMVGDAVAAIPDDSSIELKAAGGKVDSNEVFRGPVTLSHNEISIALLDQNQITEANSNKTLAQAGLEVTADIHDADTDTIQAAVNQIIRTVATLNLGDVPCPVWAIQEQKTIDGTRATRGEKLTRTGLHLVPQCFKHECQLQDGDIDEAPPSERQGNMLSLSFAEATDADTQAQQQPDDVLDILMNGGVLNGTPGPVLTPLFRRVGNGISPAELLGEPAKLYPQMDTNDLQGRLAHILFVANIWGRLREHDND